MGSQTKTLQDAGRFISAMPERDLHWQAWIHATEGPDGCGRSRRLDRLCNRRGRHGVVPLRQIGDAEMNANTDKPWSEVDLFDLGNSSTRSMNVTTAQPATPFRSMFRRTRAATVLVDEFHASSLETPRTANSLAFAFFNACLLADGRRFRRLHRR
jgi:hypothetical protein